MRKKGSCVVNPIYYWLDTDIWDYIKQENIEVNPLYAEGRKRIGCILCPMSSYKEKLKYIQRYPTYVQAYKNAFQKMIDENEYTHYDNGKWENGEEVFRWWIAQDKHEVRGQLSMFDEVQDDI